MKKQKKTYGIKHFMEYQAVIKVGKNNMKVLFTDGSLSAMGVNPATFTTDKYMVQHAIENSSEFKRGLIYIVNSVDLEEDVEIERNVGKITVPVATEESPADNPIAVNMQNEKVAEAQEEKVQEEEVQDEVINEDNSEVALTQVEFASNDEAKDYLEQTFGLVRSKLRKREEIVNAGRANGVEIIFV